MVNIKHTPATHTENVYTIVGDSVCDIVDECLKRIRPSSKYFYERELNSDLRKRGFSYIDPFAGMGNSYKVYTLKKYQKLEDRQSKLRDKALTELTKQSQELGLDY